MASDISTFQAGLLGVVEGLTEFLPISSTGHLLMAGWAFGLDERFVDLFVVPIQFGAILAVMVLYHQRILKVITGLFSDAGAQRFTLALIMAFLPAAVIGLLLHSVIKGIFAHVIVVPIMLVLGGIAILWIEKRHPEPEVFRAEEIHPFRAFLIGCCQALAMVPGVSRSGATIMGSLLLGVERKAAAEFSFFLAIPTMLAAAGYDLFKQRELLTMDDAGLIAIGFVAAFVAAMLVVKALMAFLARHTFAVFGWYRIVVGVVMFGLISLGAQ